MSIEQAFEICLKLWLLLGVIGAPLAMSAGFRDIPRKARTAPARTRVDTRRRMSARTKRTKTKPVRYQAPALSDAEMRTLTDYFIKRDNVRA